MLARAKAKGIPNFHIFGEVATGDYDPALLANWTRRSGLPAVLDFAFMRAANDAAGGKTGTGELARMVSDDALYQGGEGRDAPADLPGQPRCRALRLFPA
jgi:hypothetical protein